MRSLSRYAFAGSCSAIPTVASTEMERPGLRPVAVLIRLTVGSGGMMHRIERISDLTGASRQVRVLSFEIHHPGWTMKTATMTAAILSGTGILCDQGEEREGREEHIEPMRFPGRSQARRVFPLPHRHLPGPGEVAATAGRNRPLWGRAVPSPTPGLSQSR